VSAEVTDPPADPPVADPPVAIPWWTRGDTNAFFGLGFNILVNVLTLTGLMIAYYIDQAYNTPSKWNLGFKVLPETFTPGMLRRLVRQHLNYYLSNGAVDPSTGAFIQRVSGGGTGGRSALRGE